MKALLVLSLLLLPVTSLALDLAADATPVLQLAATSLDVQVQGRVEEGRLIVQEQLQWTLQ